MSRLRGRWATVAIASALVWACGIVDSGSSATGTGGSSHGGATSGGLGGSTNPGGTHSGGVAGTTQDGGGGNAASTAGLGGVAASGGTAAAGGSAGSAGSSGEGGDAGSVGGSGAASGSHAGSGTGGAAGSGGSAGATGGSAGSMGGSGGSGGAPLTGYPPGSEPEFSGLCSSNPWDMMFCRSDQWCSTCGFGQCAARPDPSVCLLDCPGVCGCDTKQYCNDCLANAAGVARWRVGPCP